MERPDNPTGLLTLANEYQWAERYKDEGMTLERYIAAHGGNRLYVTNSL